MISCSLFAAVRSWFQPFCGYPAPPALAFSAVVSLRYEGDFAGIVRDFLPLLPLVGVVVLVIRDGVLEGPIESP